MKNLTEKQTEIICFIENFIAKNQYPPTIREIGDGFNMSTKGAYDHVNAIEKKGYISRCKKISRSIRIMER